MDSLRHHLKVEKEKMKGFNSVAQLREYLYLCGVASINEHRLNKYGITHVLNTATELKDFQYPSGITNILRVEMKDSASENLLKYIDQCIDYIHMVRNNGGKVLVHCIAGMSRSVSVCLAYLVKYDNMTLKDAYDHVFNERRFIHPNQGFWKSLISFEEERTGKNTVEIRPYICGWEINVIEYETDCRIVNGWLEDLFRFLLTPFLILVMQMIWTGFKS